MSANKTALELDPEKWRPVFGKDRAQTKRQGQMTVRREVILPWPATEQNYALGFGRHFGERIVRSYSVRAD
jgi:hypothetical protein